MESIAGWVAPAATMIAAVMTAANLGARVTGWGFVVFSVAAVAWVVVAISSGQQNLLLTNVFLLFVNIVGVWRWLGRQAKYEDGGEAAARRSARKPVPTLFSASSLAGLTVADSAGEKLGSVVDAMLRCGRNDIAYIVVTDGGTAGMAETLRAIGLDSARIGNSEVKLTLTRQAFERIAPVDPQNWPEALPAG